jgi:WD40 repeat protein
VAPPRGDRLGDPLPEGALARLGTSRLRGERWYYFLPDGRRLLLPQADRSLQIFEVATGKPLARIRPAGLPGEKQIIGSTVGFSPDGRYVAAACWEGGSGIWEAATGRLVRGLDTGGFYSILRCDFSPDGKRVAVGGKPGGGGFDDNSVGVYEVESGRRLLTVPGTNSAFAADGRSLVVWPGYGAGPAPRTARRVSVPGGEVLASFSHVGNFPDFTPRSDGTWVFDVLADNAVEVRDAAGGELKHTFRGPEGGEDERVYVRHAPGRRELVVVGTRPPGVWCWDLGTGKQLWHARLKAPAYFPALSSDGSTLVTGDNVGVVQVWDVAAGKERTSFRPGVIGQGTGVAVSPGGKVVATSTGGSDAKAVALWDAATGKLLSDLPGHPSGVTAAAFAPGGAVYTSGKDRTLRGWDAAAGRELSRAEADPAAFFAAAPDGKTLYAAGPGPGPVRILDARTGRTERQLPGFTKSLVGMALTADGKRLVLAGQDGDGAGESRVRILDAVTGAKLGEFAVPGAPVEQLAVRPDGGAVATTQAGQRVVLWDGAGKQRAELFGRGKRTSAWARTETPYRIGSVALAPDGRWLAYSDQEEGVALVDARTGVEVGRAKPEGVYYQMSAARTELRDVLAFSPDGKTVAWSGVESTADVFLIEARTQRVRRRLPGDSIPVQHLAFSPDGGRLLSAGPDGSALVWDVLGRAPGRPAAAPSPARVAAWWDELAAVDAERAYRAMRELAAHPDAAVALLREKLRPVREAGAAELDALLERLDAPEFEAREEASRQLAGLADAAESRLRATSRAPASPEVKRRLAEALDRIEAGRLRPERAIEVLERIGDAAALRMLKELAGGMPGAAQTADAAAAVARVDRAREARTGP